MVVAGPEADVARRRIVEFGLVGRRAIAGFRAVEAVVRIIRIAQAEIDAERMGQGHVGQDRQFKFAIDFPDLDSALRFENPLLLRQLIGPEVERRSEEHTSELQSLMRTSYAVFCLKQKKKRQRSTK